MFYISFSRRRAGAVIFHTASLFACFLLSLALGAQTFPVAGKVIGTDGLPLESVSVQLDGVGRGTLTDSGGSFVLAAVPAGPATLKFSSIGYQPWKEEVEVTGEMPALTIVLESRDAFLDEVVVSGSLKEVSRSSSPVPIEVYTAKYFAANPAPNFFESLQQVNGVRPQLNCNVCNTGDIHINGLEGPYTMVLLDGMPIVSGLSTVYGLTGIPQRLVERMEVVKGPASTLYGSEAVGGLINIITRDPGSGPSLVTDAMVTSWGETNVDLGLNRRIGEGSRTLLGINYFRYDSPRDNNGDNFTDVTLQDRISVFNKWSFDRADERVFTLAARYLYEDRWGGELNFGPEFRGGDQVYGESIYTNRWEGIGSYQLAVPGEAFFRFSLNGHYHDSAYGTTIYTGKQYIGFGQFTYRPETNGRHDLLFGAAYRYTWYDDNTTATSGETGNVPSRISLPGGFVQDEFRIDRQNTLLLGMRFDHNNLHGAILTPRLNYKWNDHDQSNVFRLSVGNGYRVANVFTEDHAALTGAREVVFAEALEPETSWNVNVNYVRRIYDWAWGIVGLDASLWYTRFGNRILPDYETNPNQIIYANLEGHAVSQGGSLNADVNLTTGTLINLGVTLQDVFTNVDGNRERQLLTEGASAVWKVTQPFSRGWSVDYTGNLYGPMRLPLLGELDNRAAMSPWFSLQNIQVTKSWSDAIEVYGGVKNLLNYTPPANSIARPFDPFDRDVTFAADGQVVPTANNPHALTFDPSYVFAPNQGIRLFLGLRYSLE